MADIQFADGLKVSKPHENAPEFVKGRISIKRETLIDWLNKQEGTYINLDIKESKSGNLYAAVDNWKPKKRQDPDMPF